MKNLGRSAAVIAAAGVISAVGIGGVMSAQASSPDNPGSVQAQIEHADGETNDDATDTGRDANPNEPGHQDASDAGDGDGESADAPQAGAEGEAETNDDATDTGPDANPNEPGHQDASDTGDGDGETAD